MTSKPGPSPPRSTATTREALLATTPSTRCSSGPADVILAHVDELADHPPAELPAELDALLPEPLASVRERERAQQTAIAEFLSAWEAS